VHLLGDGAIVVRDWESVSVNPQSILDRGLSFHYLPEGIYSARANEAEASYVAQSIKSILAANAGKTIGVAAFSKAQQACTEQVLSDLAEADDTFALQLNGEQERFDNGEFTGLFVKNLEIVQGDERDIIIVSVCYGPNVSGNMRMNFGPVNKAAGEKRLNVIFSRAREHMAIISSITGDAITNDYNTGAPALKTMLEFAEAVSCGKVGIATGTLSRHKAGRGSSWTGRDLALAISLFADILRSRHGLRCKEGVVICH